MGHPVNVGDKPKLKENETFYRHGMGCTDYPDCFTCPYPDCHAKHERFLTKNTVVSDGSNDYR